MSELDILAEPPYRVDDFLEYRGSPADKDAPVCEVERRLAGMVRAGQWEVVPGSFLRSDPGKTAFVLRSLQEGVYLEYHGRPGHKCRHESLALSVPKEQWDNDPERVRAFRAVRSRLCAAFMDLAQEESEERAES